MSVIHALLQGGANADFGLITFGNRRAKLIDFIFAILEFIL